MNQMERQVDALLELGGVNRMGERQAIRNRIVGLLRQEAGVDWEPLVRGLLLEFGAPDHLLGHEFMVYALCLCLEDSRFLHALTYSLYPRVAVSFDTDAHRVERSLRTLVENIWLRGDPPVLEHWFAGSISAGKGKPTCGEFIARCVNIIKSRGGVLPS